LCLVVATIGVVLRKVQEEMKQQEDRERREAKE